jgi:hypothetical protein
MFTMTRSVCIDAPVSAVWAVLSDLDAIQVWVSSIRRSHCPGQDRGVGALCVCELQQGPIRETIVDWQEGRSFKYRGEGAPMMKLATNEWTVEPPGNQTIVTTTAEVVLKGGVFGVLLQPLVRIHLHSANSASDRLACTAGWRSPRSSSPSASFIRRAPSSGS